MGGGVVGGGVVGGGVGGGGVGLGGFFLLPCPGGVGATLGETGGVGAVTGGVGVVGGTVGVAGGAVGVAIGGGEGLTEGAGVGFLAWAAKPMHKNAVAPAMIQIVRLIP